MQLSMLFREMWLRVGGEQASQEINNIITRVTSSFHVEHQPDNTHGDVHALTLSERGRSTALGVSIPVAWNPSDYTATGGMTWGVDPTDIDEFSYMLVGNWMFITGIWNTTSVTAPLSTTLMVKIPGGFTCNRRSQALARAVDAGAATVAVIDVPKNGKVMNISRNDGANWAAAVNTTSVRVFIGFEIR